MRNLHGIILAGTLIVAGCGKEDSTNAGAPAQSPPPAATQPETPTHTALGERDGYLGTVVKAQQSAVKGIDTSALTEEITLFQAQEGRYPKDLNELVTMHYLGKLPDAPVGMKLNYNPATGKVAVVPQ